MLRSTRSPDTHTYLADNHNPRSRNALKFASALSVIVVLGALSIWAFTPISEEANYKLDRPLISNSIRTGTDAPQINPEVAKNTPSDRMPASDAHRNLQAPSKIDDLIVEAEADGYLEFMAARPLSGADTNAGTNIETHSTIISKVSTGSKASSEENSAAIELITVPAPAVEAAPIAGAKLLAETNQTALVSAPKDFDQTALNKTASDQISLDKTTLDQTAKTSAAPGNTPEASDQALSADVVEFTIKSGDTLTRIFSNAKLPISQAINLSRNKAAAKLNRLSIGKTLRIYYDENKQLQTLQYDIDKLNTLMVSSIDGAFDVYTHEKQVEYRTFTAQGTIESSLGAAAEVAGISAGVSGDLIDIYKWEIDFARDLHKGDHFSVIYQKAYIEGQYIANGPILAASFTTGGRTIEAVRYTDSEGATAYFQPNGESLRRGFLRSPVQLARVTSRFGKRLHPIKKTWKKHKGVDYGAKRGASIMATADGVVQYAGKKGGYGRAVILRHGGIYTTLYAHMSKIGKGVRAGKSVSQGQIIGYVGKSGWATGNHLHYEFRVNGQHKDPLKVKLPKTLPLAKQEQKKFTKHADTMLATLASLDGTRVAELEIEPGGPTL